MLDLEVIPERSLGCSQWKFIIGMSIYQVIRIIRSQYEIIKEVDFIYDEMKPLESDIIIKLPLDGICFIHEPDTQRLKIIEVYDLDRVKLTYSGSHFNSPTIKPTFEQVTKSFGHTRPGEYDTANRTCTLNFRGLSFVFSGNFKYEPSNKHGVASIQISDSDSISRIYIYDGSSLKDTRAPPIPLDCYLGNCFTDKVEVVTEDGLVQFLKFRLLAESSLKEVHVKEGIVKFGDTCQNVTTILGAPCRIFYKPEDKMRIHSPSPRKLSNSQWSDYFFNYFTLGIDILFDGRTHRVKKFILHTNYPGHYNFSTYYRCNFFIKVFNGNDASSTNTVNPFGPTFCYGYQNMIIEVMENNHIASVTLFSKESI
ncbi:uncharacterized protein TRIADDRAFT_49777 [Trichoplax adhaerens]|uniref:Uncharacterized protein n=1 Tax=Trichoplax adhaerens TaxID=10228 RepID=B3RIS8_TRIAD|nr:hypothetical protein TRIADDRAFT_49777 [Trichoplax adhaerens]EDV29033.1 hypothetical protein TRIADDRAFT_49777 [Trichoplax adhaerens]|eukprot:XP_002108235.1 hypothetical protein TRIADDRAFT_49777 [Trichoplax adhaerens]